MLWVCIDSDWGVVGADMKCAGIAMAIFWAELQKYGSILDDDPRPTDLERQQYVTAAIRQTFVHIHDQLDRFVLKRAYELMEEGVDL
jgi:hypothetical protein